MHHATERAYTSTSADKDDGGGGRFGHSELGLVDASTDELRVLAAQRVDHGHGGVASVDASDGQMKGRWADDGGGCDRECSRLLVWKREDDCLQLLLGDLLVLLDDLRGNMVTVSPFDKLVKDARNGDTVNNLRSTR